MSDTTVTKIDSRHSPHGELGQKYLASGKNVAMRLWEARLPGEPKPEDGTWTFVMSSSSGSWTIASMTWATISP